MCNFVLDTSFKGGQRADLTSEQIRSCAGIRSSLLFADPAHSPPIQPPPVRDRPGKNTVLTLATDIFRRVLHDPSFCCPILHPQLLKAQRTASQPRGGAVTATASSATSDGKSDGTVYLSVKSGSSLDDFPWSVAAPSPRTIYATYLSLGGCKDAITALLTYLSGTTFMILNKPLGRSP